MLCKSCLFDKRAEAFYASNRSRCKECIKASVRQNRLDKIDHYRSFDRNRAMRPDRVAARQAYQKTPEGKLAHAKANERWAVANAVRRKASHTVNNAIRDGKLQRQPCFICGEKAHANHPDYSRPLDVTWLCPKHHKDAHRISANDDMARGARETLHY